MSEPIIESRDVAIREGFHDWLHSQPPLLQFDCPDEEYWVLVLEGAPDRNEEDYGYTLYWRDGVANEWAEHYSELATTVARLATLMRGASRNQFFADGPIGFVRWSENFFRQALAPNVKPIPQGGE